MPFTNEQRGRDAEARATVLTNAAGLRPSGFTFDVHGADCYVELPFPAGPGSIASYPLDAVPALIQVKGTIRSRFPVSLAVWKKLIRAPQPAFFLVYEYPDLHAIEPSATYLVHVDQALTERALRRCWEIESKSDGSLGDHELDLAWGPEHRLEAPAHESLKARMLAAVGDPAYSLRKFEWVSKAGKSERPMKLAVGLRGTRDDVAEQLAEFAVGLRADMRFASIEATITRFETARPDPRVSGGDGLLQWPHGRPPSLPCVATLRHETSGDEVELRGELRSSHLVFRWLDASRFIVRFVHPHLDITIRFGASTANLAFDIPAGKTRLDALAAAGRAFELLSRGGCELSFTIGDSPPHREPLVSVLNPLQFSPVLRDVLEGAVRARVLARHVDSPEDCLVDPDEMANAVPLLRRAALLVKPPNSRIDFSVTLDTSSVGERIAIFLPHWLTIGDEIVILHGAFVGPATSVTPVEGQSGASVEVIGAQPMLLVAKRLSRTAAEGNADGLVEEAIAKLSASSAQLHIIEPPGEPAIAWGRFRASVFERP